MRVPLAKRLVISFCNIFFPPLAVALLTGWTSHETFLNSMLFLLAVIPSHVHGFYISIVYFTRKRRVRQGKWPGKPHKAGIRSEKVLTGGAGWKGAETLKPSSRKDRRAGRSRSQSATRQTGAITPQISRQSTVRRQPETVTSQISRQNTVGTSGYPMPDSGVEDNIRGRI